MRRTGFTLIEILLVLAIIVAVAALSAPVLRGVIQDTRLRAAGETVRTEWTRAHVKAMKTGRIQVFRYELGGTKYSVQPWIAGDDALESNAQATSSFDPPEKQDSANRGEGSELPEGTMFVGGDAVVESRSISIEQAAADATQFQAEWSRPILFYPDGSTSDAFVLIANERDVGVRVELRGMTGTATLGEITMVEDL
jgi:prepilin-type N-terminal cleavage/methylation domain-containing protein